MRDLHQPVEILSEGWKRIEFPRRVYENDADSFTPIIPSDTLLDELIRIPQSLWYDPLEFQRYRNKLLPQQYDDKSQKLLRDYSNDLVDSLNENRFGSEEQSATIKFLEGFCTRYSINHEYFEYNLLLVNYCKKILPLQKPDRADRGSLETLLVSKYGKCKNAAELMKVNSYAYLRGEIIVGYSPSQMDKDFHDMLYDDEREEVVKKILSEYKEYDDFKKIEEYNREKERCDAILSNRFSELPDAFRQVKFFIKQVERRGEINEFNQAVIEDSTNSRKQLRQSAAVPYLQQCAYCYRFWENHGTKISIIGNSDFCKEYCKKHDDSRRRKLRRKQ
jgi:hypothetical protein